MNIEPDPIDYETVQRDCTIQGHHGGRAVVYKSKDPQHPHLSEGEYCVVDVDSETFLKRFPADCSAAYPFGYAEGYDDGHPEE